MIAAGIDEAGRGSVIGPLAIAIVCGEEEGINPEYRDSKKIGREKRKQLRKEIEEKFEFHVRLITAEEINEKMQKKISLNVIEAEGAAELISSLKNKPEAIYLDSPYPEPERYSTEIRKFLNEEFRNMKLVSENFADSKYKICSAASIVAKVSRDEEIEKIKKELGCDFNSGYPSDEETRKFLKENMKKEECRKYIRKKWKTLKRISQKTLEEYQ